MDDADRILVDCDKDARLRDTGCQPVRCRHGPETRLTMDKVMISDTNLFAFNSGDDTRAWLVVEILRISQRDPTLLSISDNRLGQRMLAELFCGGGQTKDLVGRCAGERLDLRHQRFALRDRSSFVENDRVDLLCGLQRIDVADEDAAL